MKSLIFSFLLVTSAIPLQAQNDTLFYDSFSGKSYEWPEMNDSRNFCYIADGVMRWSHYGSGGTSLMHTISRFRKTEDFLLEASFSVSKSGEYGFIWGAKNDDNGLYFLVSATEFRIFKSVNAELKSIQEYTFSSMLNPRENVLKVQKKGGTVYFSINGHMVHKETDPGTYGNLFGLSLWNNADVKIGYFLLKQNQVPINLATDIIYRSEPENLGNLINTEYNDLGPIVSPDGNTLYFTRRRHPLNAGGELDEEDIYFAKRDNKGEWVNGKNIGRPLNNFHPNAVCSVTPDGNSLLLINEYGPDGNIIDKGASLSRRTATGWSVPVNLNIRNFYNDSEYNEFCLGGGGKVLLMAVERKDGHGRKDIYVSFNQGENDWSEPVNLGKTVNTKESDSCPFLAADGKTLYYSTSGHPSFGSADIFVTRRLDDSWTKWSKPQNLGKPINTKDWDGYYSIPASGEYAYFVSYENSIGGADIFRIRLPQELRPEPVVMISGKVLDADTRAPLGAKIIYESLDDGKEAGIAWSNPETGEYRIVLPYGKHYGFRAEADKHIAVNENIDITSTEAYTEIERDLILAPIHIGQNIQLKNVFFKMATAELLQTSYPELDRLVKIMKENPSIQIELAGHTDNIGNPDNLVKVSELRVQAVKDYLVRQGIQASRISGKGYGGIQPIASNDSEETRKLNRRVEFKIVKF